MCFSHSKSAVVLQPSPSRAGAGMCSNMLFTYPLQKTSGFHIGQEVPLERSKPQRSVNTTDWLPDIDGSVYTSAWDKLLVATDLIIVYTVSWNKQPQRKWRLFIVYICQLIIRGSGRKFQSEPWSSLSTSFYSGGSTKVKQCKALTAVLPKAKHSRVCYCAY